MPSFFLGLDLASLSRKRRKSSLAASSGGSMSPFVIRESYQVPLREHDTRLTEGGIAIEV